MKKALLLSLTILLFSCGGGDNEDCTTMFYLDADGDGFGSESETVISCSLPDGYSNNNTDCDDSNFSVNPNADEIGDNIDNNCNGEIDEGLVTGFVTDIDGNNYNWKVFGNQTWTIQDARTKTYNNGEAIPQIINPTEWQNRTEGAWCYYDNDSSNGILYNWLVVGGNRIGGNRSIAPEGWHIPSRDEYIILLQHLVDNGFNYDGSNTHQNFEKLGKAMSSNTGWLSSSVIGDVGNNQNTNNTSGFNATPNGYRSWGDNGSSYFERKGWETHYWTTTEDGSGTSVRETFSLYYAYPHAIITWYRPYSEGSSVRFIRD